MMPHWINITGRTQGQVFQCSECKGKCNCIARGGKDTNICNYKYCPRCGKEMDLSYITMLVHIEKPYGDQSSETNNN